MPTVNAEFRWRRLDSADWTERNIVLEEGEPGLERDTGLFKIGTGFTMWTQLPYFLDQLGIEVYVQDLIADLGGGTFDARVGDLNDLSTTIKTDLVSAINEINLPIVPFTLLYENAKAGG